MEATKAIGYPGSWFAKVDDELLPCVHQERITDGVYTEPYVKASKGKWPKFLAAIKDGRRVAVTRSVMKDGEPKRRAGYIAVYRIEDFTLDGTTMQFRVGEFLQALK